MPFVFVVTKAGGDRINMINEKAAYVMIKDLQTKQQYYDEVFKDVIVMFNSQHETCVYQSLKVCFWIINNCWQTEQRQNC